jgi:hypothetical protein
VSVDIEVFGQLLPGQPRRHSIDIPEPAPVHELAIGMGLDLQEIGLVTINGVQSRLEDPVPIDSRLCFFPFVDGG